MPQINHGCVLTPTGSDRCQSLKIHTSPLRIDHRHIPHPHHPHYAVDHQDHVHITINVVRTVLLMIITNAYTHKPPAQCPINL